MIDPNPLGNKKKKLDGTPTPGCEWGKPLKLINKKEEKKIELTDGRPPIWGGPHLTLKRQEDKEDTAERAPTMGWPLGP